MPSAKNKIKNQKYVFSHPFIRQRVSCQRDEKVYRRDKFIFELISQVGINLVTQSQLQYYNTNIFKTLNIVILLKK